MFCERFEHARMDFITEVFEFGWEFQFDDVPLEFEVMEKDVTSDLKVWGGFHDEVFDVFQFPVQLEKFVSWMSIL